MKQVIITLSVLTIVGVGLFYFITQDKSVEVIIVDYNPDCSHDGRHFTITEVIDGDSGLLGELVLINFQKELLNKYVYSHHFTNVKKMHIVGYYSYFEHREWYAGCTGSHILKVEKVIAEWSNSVGVEP